jgi:mRNA-degrading endonuclease toxin of MazEF toxin-antitoxin module
MLKNIAGQFVGVQMVSSADGTAFSGTVTVYVTVDNGTQTIGSVGSGVCSHKGNGLHNYAPSQAETNGSSIQFTFIGTGAIPQTIQFETLPTTGVLAPTVANRTIAVSATTGKVTAEAVELDSDAQAMVAAFNAMRSGNVFTAPALANAPTGGSGSGTGARTVTITVNDGTTVLQNARVRFTEGANTYTALTNASGVAVFNLDDATYTVAITKAGYNYAGTTMVVNGTETATYSMTAINITPGSGNFTTGYVTCFDQDGQVLPNCKVYQRMIEVPANDAGFAYDSSQTSATSNSEGVTEFPRLVKGGSYLFFRGSEREGTVVTIPTTAGSTYALPSVIGR